MSTSLKHFLEPDEQDEPIIIQLKLWLRGIATNEFSITQQPPIELWMLQKVLRLAILELIVFIDTEMEGLIDAAADQAYSMRVDEDSIWKTRQLDTVGLRCRVSVAELSREAVVEQLEHVKRELAWMTSEIRRLNLHMDNAKEQIANGWRTSFVYRGLPRDNNE